MKKTIKNIRNAVVALAVGGATLGVVKGCEHVENEKINKEFFDEHTDADSIIADAAHNRFYAEKKADTKKMKEIEKEIRTLEEKKAKLIDSLMKQQKEDDRAFLKACKTGKKEDVEKIVAAANLNATDKDGNNGLMLALENKNFASAYAISQFLLKEKGMDVNKENKRGVNAVDLIRQLMAKNPAWSPIERKIMEKSEQPLSGEEEKPIIYNSPEKKALSNKIEFCSKKIADLRQEEEKYSAYLFDAKNGSYNFSTESAVMYNDGEDENVKKEIVSLLKDNSKKREKGQKVKKIGEEMLDRF